MSQRFDAIVIGGGAKTLPLAIYLAKYGGMKTVIFEKNHEIGGGLTTSECSAPGFLHNRHATEVADWYWEPLFEDFPDINEKGLEVIYPPIKNAAIFKNQKVLAHYSQKMDPDQKKTAQEIARFSKSDAKTWLVLHEKFQKKWWKVFLDWIYSPPTQPGEPDPLEKLLSDPKGDFDDYLNCMSAIRLLQELFESPQMISLCANIRHRLQGFFLDFPGGSFNALALMFVPYGFVKGGTHRAAHAMHRIFMENDGLTYTHKGVKSILIKNGEAKGVVLEDGKVIESKIVISGTGPYQLLDLVGEDNLPKTIVKRIRLCTQTTAAVSWYGWALHDAPSYGRAAKSMPEILHGAHRTHINVDEDISQLLRQDSWRRLGQIPPSDDTVVDIWCWTIWDKSQAPDGKHVAGTETFIVPATAMSEDKWLDFKQKYADTLLELWHDYAPNMTWDNVIGYDPVTTYDTARELINMSPGGHTGSVDPMPWCVGRYRPTPELSQHRTPIKNLYATGAGWHPGGGAVSCNGYNCYKIIAEDLGLRKPWVEKGRSF